MNREERDQLDAIGKHPELVALAAACPPGLDVAATARAVALRLAGVPVHTNAPLASLLITIARAEIALLERLCYQQPLKAAAATIALMKALLPRYPTAATDGAEAGAATPPAPTMPSGPQTDAGAEDARIRASLAALTGRQWPDTVPVPRMPETDHSGDPVRMAANLAERMKVNEAASAAWNAIEQCDDLINALSSLLPGFGWDFSTATLTRTLLQHLKRLSMLFSKLKILQRIVDDLGRMETSARKRSRSERGGRDSVIGVRVGGELADVLPCELALLGQHETEDLFYQRFVEHRLLSLELKGTAVQSQSDSEDRGPIVACVDTSGSMHGTPEAVAKALILAVVRQARSHGRPLRLIQFGGPGDLVDLDIRHNRRSLDALLEFLSMAFHAGTDFDGPLQRAMVLLDDDVYHKADLLVVTDGLCRASQDIEDQVQEAKKSRNFRILSVVVGGDASSVHRFSDQVWEIDPAAPVASGIDLRQWNRG